MDISSWVSFILVILGAVIMGINIIKYFKTYRNFKLIPNTSRKFLNIECKVHLLLMCFFLLGYLSVAIGSQLDEEISKVFLNIPIEELDRCLPKNL